MELLVENSRGRMEELIPILHGRMMVSPFTFYRGAAAIMAYDLSNTPSTGLTLVADGDCHLLNFGGFATAERKLIFDINDFDEVSFAPWEWDLKRLVTSFVIAGQSNGFSLEDSEEAGWLGPSRPAETGSSWVPKASRLEVSAYFAALQQKVLAFGGMPAKVESCCIAAIVIDSTTIPRSPPC